MPISPEPGPSFLGAARPGLSQLPHQPLWEHDPHGAQPLHLGKRRSTKMGPLLLRLSAIRSTSAAISRVIWMILLPPSVPPSSGRGWSSSGFSQARALRELDVGLPGCSCKRTGTANETPDAQAFNYWVDGPLTTFQGRVGVKTAS